MGFEPITCIHGFIQFIRYRTCFEEAKILEYWKSDLELEKWFYPAFEELINKEIFPAIKENK